MLGEFSLCISYPLVLRCSSRRSFPLFVRTMKRTACKIRQKTVKGGDTKATHAISALVPKGRCVGVKDRDCSKSSDKVHILIVKSLLRRAMSRLGQSEGKTLSLSTRRLLETFEKSRL